MFKACALAIDNSMTREEHVVISGQSYKESVLAFQRLIDFLSRYNPANQLLIEDHENKVKAKKKTRRYVPTE